MFDDISISNMRNYRKEFKRIFKRFCKNTPLFLYFTMAEDKIHIFESDPETNVSALMFIYDLDHSINVRENIAKIRKELRAWYPILIESVTTYVEYSPEEMKELALYSNIDVDTLLEKKKAITSENIYVIEKVSIWKDELIIRTCDSGVLGLYKSKVPILSLLKKIKLTPQEEVMGYLRSKTTFIKQVFEDNGGK